MTEFCISCRREQEVIIRKEKREMDVCGKPRDFSFTVFRCKECGGEMSPPGSMDLCVTEYQEQLERIQNPPVIVLHKDETIAECKGWSKYFRK